MDYNNLHKKTIYDFTTDAKVIDEITAGLTKEEYLANLKTTPVNTALGCRNSQN